MVTTSSPASGPALPPKTRDALTAAHLYYLQDLTMDAIAHELRTSRSSVSRLLSHARDTGLVTIQVSSPLDKPRQLENDIARRFGVVAHVVPVPDQTSDIDRLERVSISAARILGGFVESNMTIGIAWGSTMTAVSRHLVTKATHNTTIVQLNGAANPRTTGIVYASELLQRFGTAYGAAVQQFAVPALFDDPETKNAMWRERSVKRVLGIQRSMDLTVFGLGTPFADIPSYVYVGGYLDDRDLESLSQAGVVGDVATVFYREDGSDDGIEVNARTSGPDLSVQRAVLRRVCVVAGASKLPSLKGALAAGLVTDLIVDSTTARMLMDGS